ncbi:MULTISPECIES: hypothetical protein [Sphingobacterium]|uniref:Uncharacterized protein n=1 Tax=Sphingobacterium populi TaxID=1812824 RepID=A0ABW5UFJ0_9SPHI|nr:hypothetical protein [Sphingobacterium sp. CFCC 11742]
MEYFDEKSNFEFKWMDDHLVRCWHSTGSSIDLRITIANNRLEVRSDNGNITRENHEKLYSAVERAYQTWGLI